MKALLLTLLVGPLVAACAPALPARPELPPVPVAAFETGGPTAIEQDAPVIPMPDFSALDAEIKAATNRQVRRQAR